MTGSRLWGVATENKGQGRHRLVRSSGVADKGHMGAAGLAVLYSDSRQGTHRSSRLGHINNR